MKTIVLHCTIVLFLFIFFATVITSRTIWNIWIFLKEFLWNSGYQLNSFRPSCKRQTLIMTWWCFVIFILGFYSISCPTIFYVFFFIRLRKVIIPSPLWIHCNYESKKFVWWKSVYWWIGTVFYEAFERLEFCFLQCCDAVFRWLECLYVMAGFAEGATHWLPLVRREIFLLYKVGILFLH